MEVSMSELISIIIPVYKVPENMLKDCIESCMNQTWKNIEIILVDDESPDKCGEICDRYKDQDARVKVIHQKNKGLSGARNTGVKNANGKWIMFVDGDDYIDLRMCKNLIKAISDKDIDVVCCPYIRKSGNKLIKCNFEGIHTGLYVNDECKLLQEKVLVFNAHFSSAYGKLIRREFLIKNDIFHNEKLRQGAEGIEFNIRVFEKTKKVLIIDEFLYYYIYNDNSISNKHDEKNHYYVLKCFETIKDNIVKSKNKDELLKLFYNRIIYVITTTAISGYFSPSNKENFKIKKDKYMKYLKQPIVAESLKLADYKEINMLNRIVILLIKFKMFRILEFLGYTRKKMKSKK